MEVYFQSKEADDFAGEVEIAKRSPDTCTAYAFERIGYDHSLVQVKETGLIEKQEQH